MLGSSGRRCVNQIDTCNWSCGVKFDTLSEKSSLTIAIFVFVLFLVFFGARRILSSPCCPLTQQPKERESAIIIDFEERWLADYYRVFEAIISERERDFMCGLITSIRKFKADVNDERVALMLRLIELLLRTYLRVGSGGITFIIMIDIIIIIAG